MIIINNSGYLKYKKLIFKCALGKSGIGKKEKEGDNITPCGRFKLTKIFYRKDRIKKISSSLKFVEIKRNMGWCDDPKSKNYNKLIKIPSKFSHEKLYRRDSIYDLILPLNFNTNKTKKGKGSAIFLHVAKKNYLATKGCIAIKKENLICLLENIKSNKIKIIKD